MSGWHPLIAGREAERFCASLDEILAGLETQTAADPWIGLLYHYTNSARTNHRYQEIAAQALDVAITSIAEGAHSPALYRGFTGVAWLAQHLGGSDTGDVYEEIDGVLHGLVSASPWRFNYD